MNRALTISAADCIGTVGIQKDISVFLKNGICPSSITTSIIAQNSQGEFKVEKISKGMLKDQIKVVFEELDFDVIKIGTLIGEDNIKLVGKELRKKRSIPSIVVNGQIVSKKGEGILSKSEKKAYIKEILPLSYLLILSKNDIEELLDINVIGIRDIEETLEKIKKLGPLNILIRNLQDEDKAVDILYDGDEMVFFKGELLNNVDTYMEGENLSAIISANIGNKLSLRTSIKNSKDYILEEKIKV
ncbi:MAG: bifunctional hydroxymethylpyrimidine kinase/phosphomethylpyrimidine kinase [Clostridium sp.]|uniref:bifunctional hydroxymethylpyrimidine kinase/phosphomethylpyrimidine kinase n=1 Tax=Clostridium sp. TaxID=1506 RepID=UPI003EE729B7